MGRQRTWLIGLISGVAACTHAPAPPPVASAPPLSARHLSALPWVVVSHLVSGTIGAREGAAEALDSLLGSVVRADEAYKPEFAIPTEDNPGPVFAEPRDSVPLVDQLLLGRLTRATVVVEVSVRRAGNRYFVRGRVVRVAAAEADEWLGPIEHESRAAALRELARQLRSPIRAALALPAR